MAQAIDRMIAEEGEEGEGEVEVGITESHTRVLSMAWHCLKVTLGHGVLMGRTFAPLVSQFHASKLHRYKFHNYLLPV